MPFDDLTPFFDTGAFALWAEFKTPQGAVLRETKVILSLPVGEMAVGAGEVAHLQPSLQCPTAEIEGVKKGFTVAVHNADATTTNYTVVRRENDGTGLSTVWLSKQ
ncbi:MAG TPA: hypothetical protein VF521_11715 [Pyrinomonadaceae bacterium]